MLKHGSAQIGSVATCNKSMKGAQYILLRVIAATEYALTCHELRDRRLQNYRAAMSTHSTPYDALRPGTGSATARSADVSSRKYTQVASRLR